MATMPTTYFRCPACNSQMDVSATSCPICLRPRSRQEMMRDLQGVKRAEKNKRRWVLISLVLLCAVAVFALHPEWLSLVKNRLAPAVAPVAARAKASVQATVQANWPGADPNGLKPVLPQESFDRATHEEAASRQASPRPATPAPALTPAALATKTPPAEEAVLMRWKIEGSIYHLMDLKPAAGVDVVFSPSNGDQARKVRSGKDGKYRIALPILTDGGGYRISIVRAGRSLPYLEEASLAYRERSKAQREDAVEEASQAPVLHAPLSPESPETRQDFALLPVR